MGSFTTTHHEQVALVTFERPPRNLMSMAAMTELEGVLEELAADEGVNVVVLTGGVPGYFVAHADLDDLAALGRGEAVEGDPASWGRALALIESMPQPVIAAVNGFAMGGGCEIALATDIRIASENAVFGQPEVGLGIPPGWGGTQRLVRAVGPGFAAEMILTGRRVKADEALRVGLVNAVVPLAELLPKARELAEMIAKSSPLAVRSAKRLMQLAFNGQISSGLSTEHEAFANAFESNQQVEGMRAFIEKRQPLFDDE